MEQATEVAAEAHHANWVISPNYCAPHPVELTIVRKAMTITHGNFDITGIDGNIVFKVRAPFAIFHNPGNVLLDAAGNPILTLRPKLSSIFHRKWKVFKGDSTDSANLLFSAKLSSTFQFKTTVDVFLANNTREDVCDFKVKQSFWQRSCVVYAGNSSTAVAQMHKKQSLFGKEKFMVTVNPNIDYAFIAAVIVILCEINFSNRSTPSPAS
ncbi:protein LURP-one-related 10-like [Corylus avellana]|uniref:protein LURP-one-related 10-like n=1 Tax=Corylus avellana TaxID=13451 RepID=UPI001E1EE434|nr:protein LURP-one-related 10-like [Corylus avellana]